MKDVSALSFEHAKKGTFLEIFKSLKRHICDPDHIFSFVELAPTFTASPPDLFRVLEGNNITLVWQYDLDGSFNDVILQFIKSSTILIIVDKHDINRDAVVPESVYLGRIYENINATQTEITIFALQRSESGLYEIELINSNRQRARNRVTVQVQCK